MKLQRVSQFNLMCAEEEKQLLNEYVCTFALGFMDLFVQMGMYQNVSAPTPVDLHIIVKPVVLGVGCKIGNKGI